MVVLKSSEWDPIRQSIQEIYGDSMVMIREKMKAELGFTVRRQSDYTNGYRRETVYLDFYNEAKETMFRLKYL